MSSHIISEEQERAFNSAVRAILKCKKLGLAIYGKAESLVAYTKEADKYADEFSPLHMIGDYGTIPHLSKSCLNDSGADDFACYATKEDELKYNPHNEK